MKMNITTFSTTNNEGLHVPVRGPLRGISKLNKLSKSPLKISNFEARSEDYYEGIPCSSRELFEKYIT